MTLTNGEALEALETFEKCQLENLSFRLKYAMARNIERLKPVKKALAVAKDVSRDENCKDFLIARKKFLDEYKGRESDANFQTGVQAIQDEFPEAITYLENKENEVREWLDSEVEGLDIFKIPLSRFPGETTIDMGKIFAFIEAEE